jgi:hypothetical protein
MTASEQATVNAIWKFLAEQEEHRKELRREDDKWRDHVDLAVGKVDFKVDRVSAVVDDMKLSFAGMPCIMDEKIAACRGERESATEETVDFVTSLRGFGMWLVKIAAAVSVGAGAAFGVGKLFGWL